MKRLIINADDFGLTAGVNRAVVELNRARKLTSTTLMAAALGTKQGAGLAHGLPLLGLGCHVVLVDGLPVLPGDELPTLVDHATGRFRPTLGEFIKDLFQGRIRASEIQAEGEAQIARVRSLGLTVTHLDSHKHTHMFPRVLGPLLAAARSQGLPAIRNPFEPRWSVQATAEAPSLRRMQVGLLRRFLPEFQRLVAGAGLLTTDGAVGVLATGTLDGRTLDSLLSAMPAGTWELVTHPGYNDADLAGAGTRLLASREIELGALNAAVFARDIELIHFGGLASSDVA